MAQQVTVSASLDKNEVFAGEQLFFQLRLAGSGASQIPQPALPDIEGLRWIKNSTRSADQYVLSNGRSSVTRTYTYLLIAEEPGNYIFPSVTVPVNGENVETRPMTFKIIDRDDLPESDPNKYPDIFLELEVDDDTPVSGQQIIASVVIYYKEQIEVASFQDVPGWKAEGFWKEDLDQGRNTSTRTTLTTRDGIRFRSAVLTRYALFPTKSGELTLSPYEVSIQVRAQRRRNSIFDSFVGTNQRRLNISSEPLTLTVAPVPEVTDAIFTGAVGDFEVKRTLNPVETIVGESIEVVTTISGTGGIPLISKPEYEYPNGLEEYQPQENTSIDRRNNSIKGSKTFSDIIIARNPGEYEIPAVNFAFFNPTTNRVVKKSLPAIPFTVSRDPNASTNALAEMQLSIQPITGLATWSSPKRSSLKDSFMTWAVLFLPLFLFTGGYLFSSYKNRMNTDTAFARSQKAYQKAQEILEKASSEDVKDGYNHIHKALTSFISDKLALAEGGISDQRYIEELQKTEADSTTVQEIKFLLTKCSTINYAPDANADTLQQDLKKATELLQKLKKQL